MHISLPETAQEQSHTGTPSLLPSAVRKEEESIYEATSTVRGTRRIRWTIRDASSSSIVYRVSCLEFS